MRLATLLVVALAGCIQADEPARETPPPSETGSPAPRPLPLPAPAPRASDAWTVTTTGAGPVRIGMPLAEAAALLGVEPDTAATAGRCAHLRSPRAPAGVKWMVNEGRVARVEVDSGAVRTAEGAGIGDPEARVRGLYPGRVAESPHKYTAGRYLTVTPAAPADSVSRLVFETDGERVTRFRAGRLPEVEWVEGCA